MGQSSSRARQHPRSLESPETSPNDDAANVTAQPPAASSAEPARSRTSSVPKRIIDALSSSKAKRSRARTVSTPSPAIAPLAAAEEGASQPRPRRESHSAPKRRGWRLSRRFSKAPERPEDAVHEEEDDVAVQEQDQDQEEQVGEMGERIEQVDKRVAPSDERDAEEQAGEASGSVYVPVLVQEPDRAGDQPSLPPTAESQGCADAAAGSTIRNPELGGDAEQDEVVIRPPAPENEPPLVESMPDAPPAPSSQPAPENPLQSTQPQTQGQQAQQQQPQRFPPPGALVVVQGVVHTTDVSRSSNSTANASTSPSDANARNATSSRRPPSFPPSPRRRASSTPRPSTLAPASSGDRRVRDRLSAVISRPPRAATPRPMSMLPSIPSSASASTSNNEPSLSASDSPWLSSDASSINPPSRGDTDRPSIDEPAGSNGNGGGSQGGNGALTPSSIDVLGTLLSVAAAATAASLLTGSSEPIFSTGLSNSAPHPNGNQQPASPTTPISPFSPASPSPFPTTTSQNDAPPARDRMRHVWSSLRDRLGLRNASTRADGGAGASGGNAGAGAAGGAGDHTRPDGTPMDAREIMLAEMARAFNLGLGINNASANANGAVNAGAAATSVRRQSRDGHIDVSQLGGGSARGSSERERDGEEGDGEAGEAAGDSEDDLPPPDSFERFLIDLQADLRIALSHDPGAGVESAGSGSDPDPDGNADRGADRDGNAEQDERRIPNVTVTAPETDDQESELEVYDTAAEDLDVSSSPTFSTSVPLQGNEREQLRAPGADEEFADMPPLSSSTDSSDEDSLDGRSHVSQSRGRHEATPRTPRGQRASSDHVPTVTASTSRHETRHEAAAAGRAGAATNANANANRSSNAPTGAAGGTPSSMSRTEHRPGGGINWWRMYRFPAITSQQVQAHHGQQQTPNQNQGEAQNSQPGGHALSATAGGAQTQVASELQGHATGSVSTQNPSTLGGNDATPLSAAATRSSVSSVPGAFSSGMSTAAAQSRPQSLAYPRSIPNLDTGASSTSTNPSAMSSAQPSLSPSASITPHFPSPSTPTSEFGQSTSAASAEGPFSSANPSTIPQSSAPAPPNVVVPVIVVGLQSVSMDRHHQHMHPHPHPSPHPHHHHHHQAHGADPYTTNMEHDPMDIDPFGGVPDHAHTHRGGAAEDEDTNMDVDPDLFGDVDEHGFEQEHGGHDRASRGRSWGSRAANAFRNLRSGASGSGAGASAGAGTGTGNTNARRAASQPRLDAPGSRTFLIYVIGGYYPPDHQIITSGNLDSFEALWELAELLGQVKPQTASKEDIEKSGLEIIKGTSLKQYEEEQKITSNCVERCLICLDDYDTEDDVRVLACRHAFHQGCVDRWLETGKNNCPACRSKGVGGDGSVPQSPTSPTTASA